MTWSDDIDKPASWDDGPIHSSVPTPVWLIGVELALVVVGVVVARSADPFLIRGAGWLFVVAGAGCAAGYRLIQRTRCADLAYQGLAPAGWRTFVHAIVLVANVAAILYTSVRGSLVIPT